jgi:hypothetical protein
MARERKVARSSHELPALLLGKVLDLIVWDAHVLQGVILPKTVAPLRPVGGPVVAAVNEEAAGMENARNLTQHIAPTWNEMKDMHAEDGVEARARERQLRRVGAHGVYAETAALGEKPLHHPSREVHPRNAQTACCERQREAAGANADFEKVRARVERRGFMDERRDLLCDAGRETTRRVVPIGRTVEDDGLLTGSLGGSFGQMSSRPARKIVSSCG